MSENATGELAVVDAPIAARRPHPRNPRTITPARLEQLKRTLEAERDMLRARPIVALPDGTVIAGNQRLAAAAELGWETLPVVYADLDEERAVRWMLLDNRSFGEDDAGLAAELLAELSESGSDLLLTGYEKPDVDRMLRAYRLRDRDPDETPPLPVEPRSKRGEVYELGPHRLMCGDATEVEQVADLMDGSLADAVFTDPPYGVGYDGGTTERQVMVGDHSTALYLPACEMAMRFSSTDAPLYLWHAGVKGYAAAAAAAAAGYEVRCEIVWNKNLAQFGALGAQYKQKHEPCYYCVKPGTAVNWSGPANEVTVWDSERAARNDFHPTQKPVALATRALRNHAAASVLDIFAGSGSTLIAAEMEGRRCFAMEIDPAYCDVIRDRYEAFVNG